MLHKLSINFVKFISDALPWDFSDSEMQCWVERPMDLKKIMEVFRNFVSLGSLKIFTGLKGPEEYMEVFKREAISFDLGAEKIIRDIKPAGKKEFDYDFVIVDPEMLEIINMGLGTLLKEAKKRKLLLLTPEMAL